MLYAIYDIFILLLFTERMDQADEHQVLYLNSKTKFIDFIELSLVQS